MYTTSELEREDRLTLPYFTLPFPVSLYLMDAFVRLFDSIYQFCSLRMELKIDFFIAVKACAWVDLSNLSLSYYNVVCTT